MPNITINGITLVNQNNESVLDTLLKENIPAPYACRQGVCQSCMMRSLDIPPPISSQIGLKDTLRRQQYFLTCMCYSTQDMTITFVERQPDLLMATTVVKQQLLAP